MSRKVRLGWLPGILFVVTCSAALVLAALVALAPELLRQDPGNQIVRVFALDNTVRRTALASALGLIVTALVFFRPGQVAALDFHFGATAAAGQHSGSLTMIGWLVDHFGLIYLILGLVILGLALAFINTRRVRYLVLIVMVIGVGILLRFLSSYVVTDRRQIEASVWEMAAAVRDHKPDKLLPHLADDFSYEGMKREEIARRVADTSRAFGVSGFHLWDFDFEQLDRDKKQAKVAFRIRVDQGGEQAFMGLCRGNFVLDASGKWRLKTFAVYNPIVDTGTPMVIPLR